MRTTVLLLSLFSCSVAMADIMEDFADLGGNAILLESAKALQPEKSVDIVQDRVVSRRWRSEFAPEFGSVIGGDAYLITHNVGFQYQLHINPQWSLGLKYAYSHNDLNREGHRLINEESLIPAIDFPRESFMALINWYPIYGKLNIFGRAIVQYDAYLMAGGGNINLRYGPSNLSTFGAGIGIWFSQYLTGRLELRHQLYNAKIVDQTVAMGTTVAGLSLGYML